MLSKLTRLHDYQRVGGRGGGCLRCPHFIQESPSSILWYLLSTAFERLEVSCMWLQVKPSAPLVPSGRSQKPQTMSNKCIRFLAVILFFLSPSSNRSCSSGGRLPKWFLQWMWATEQTHSRRGKPGSIRDGSCRCWSGCFSLLLSLNLLDSLEAGQALCWKVFIHSEAAFTSVSWTNDVFSADLKSVPNVSKIVHIYIWFFSASPSKKHQISPKILCYCLFFMLR